MWIDRQGKIHRKLVPKSPTYNIWAALNDDSKIAEIDAIMGKHGVISGEMYLCFSELDGYSDKELKEAFFSKKYACELVDMPDNELAMYQEIVKKYMPK